ncbi:MAG: diaminopimelate epimerase [Chitinivibrionales bacterium]|nr:diaminopimelate epimerase [Chitinivibrionales bacterium]
MKFTKMHGIGNDFILTHGYSDQQIEALRPTIPALCDRRKGIGADGTIFVLPPLKSKADFRMRIFNADGSEPEMCGNGIRCFSRYVFERELSLKKVLFIETGAGVKITTREEARDLITVDMGKPILDAAQIPTRTTHAMVVMEPLQLGAICVQVTAVSMGNPHCVIFVDAITDEHLRSWGPQLQSHPFFPKSVNVEFVQVVADNEVRMRVLERGCGETQACGTGACACVVAGILNKKNSSTGPVTVHLTGGDLLIAWDGDPNHSVFKTGPAAIVFEGSCDWCE